MSASILKNHNVAFLSRPQSLLAVFDDSTLGHLLAPVSFQSGVYHVQINDDLLYEVSRIQLRQLA